MPNTPIPEFTSIFAVLLLPVALIPAVLLLGKKLHGRVGYIAMIAPLGNLLLLSILAEKRMVESSHVVAFAWVPSLGINFSFLLDGVSIFYGFIICGIGVLVCWYGAEYLGKKYAYQGRFFSYLLFFMTAMLGTVFSDNILLLYIFWELTGIASFLLIGFLHEKSTSQKGARCALLVSVGTGLFLLAGVLLLGQQYGTFSFSEMISGNVVRNTNSTPWLFPATTLLLLIGAFGKSAQFPFHFWLPEAMVAPTPVSAYLHSAAMVKLGIFLVARLFPLFHVLDLWFWSVCGIGFFTMLLGAFLAWRSDDLKMILAYSTVSQLGFLIGTYGLAGKTGVQMDFLHVANHVFYKAGLFMVVGIIEQTAGTRDIRKLGGLWRTMPLTTLAAAIGAASLAGLPFTTGFLSKEILLTDMANAQVWLFYGVLIFSAVFTVAFALRLFLKPFTGAFPEKITIQRPGLAIQIPPLLLALAVLMFGIFPGITEDAIVWFKTPGLHTGDSLHLTLWHGFNRELFVTIGIIIFGSILFLLSEKTQWRWTGIPRILQFDHFFEKGLNALLTYSKSLTRALRADWPPAYLPIVICFLLFTLVITVFISPGSYYEIFTRVDWVFSPLRTTIAMMVCLGLLGVIVLSRWALQLISLSAAGFFLTFYFVLYHAPDLAMTQILVETASTVLILLLLSRFPSTQLFVRADLRADWRRTLHIVLSVFVGLGMTALVLFSEIHQHPDPIGPELAAMSQSLAEGTNTVNTILVDFRGFDTMGEITVLLIATFGALGLMMRYKRQETGRDTMLPPGFFLGKGKK